MPAPFFVFLQKTHMLPKVTSYDADRSAKARVLQTFIDAGDNNGYRKQLANYQEEGASFRLTDMKVYETKNEGEKIEVRLALQVKAQSITWYFWAKDGKDQYSQEFRDKLYNAAAECHAKVKNGCDMYFRGSNAFHIKTMHHLESEADHNHNHYRVKGERTVSPEDLKEHLQAFKQHEVHDLFFAADEIDKVCSQYAEFYQRWTTKNGEKSSLEEQYMTDSTQVLNQADVIEFKLFGEHQEPCRINVAELKADLEAARKAIEESLKTGDSTTLRAQIEKMEAEFKAIMEFRKASGSRAVHPELTMTRQLEGSKIPTIKQTITARDDAVGSDIPSIPDWAVRARRQVEEANKEFARRVIGLSPIPAPAPATTSTNNVERQPSPFRNNMKYGTLTFNSAEKSAASQSAQNPSPQRLTP